MTYYVYMVRCADGSHYTGLCTDPQKRMREHTERTAACAKYTRSHPAVALDALWKTGSRSDAAKLEARIKRLSKAKKLALIERPEALDKGCFVLAGISEGGVEQAVATAVAMNANGDNGIPVPYYTEDVSTKVVKIIQSYTGVVNKMVWRKG